MPLKFSLFIYAGLGKMIRGLTPSTSSVVLGVPGAIKITFCTRITSANLKVRARFCSGWSSRFSFSFPDTANNNRASRVGKRSEVEPEGNAVSSECAPVLVGNDHPSDFDLVKSFASRTQRVTIEGGFSSRIRSSVKALPQKMATQVIEVYERLRSDCESSCIAKEYWEALPYHNTVKSKQERKQRYEDLSHPKPKLTSKLRGTCNIKENKLTRKC